VLDKPDLSLRVPGHPLRFGPGTWFTSPLR
jgi:hypothetical protein